MESLSKIKDWFRSGLKPTQMQFWATFDSFWHKEQSIPQSAVASLGSTLDAKANVEDFNNHLRNAEAHPQLVAAVKALMPVSAAFGNDGLSLEFKAPDGNVLFTTTIAIENINGLPAQLDNHRYRKVKNITTEKYTATEDDARNKLQFDSASAQVFYIDGDFPDCVFEGVQYGTGEVNILAADGSGVKILTAPTEEARTSEQYSVFAVEWQAENTYLVYGKLQLA